MTEAEWLECTDPRPMLRSIIAKWTSRTNRAVGTTKLERLRLFACACCRRAWELLDENHRRSVLMIEEYIKTPVSGGLRTARRECLKAGNYASSEVSRVFRESPDDKAAQLQASARNWASSAVWEAAAKKPTSAANAHLSIARAIGQHRMAIAMENKSSPPQCYGSIWEIISETELAA